MKSTKKYRRKWKWGLIGGSFGLIGLVSLSLGIALSAQNKSLYTSSKYFIGQNSLNDLYNHLKNENYSDLPSGSNTTAWNTLANKFNLDTYNPTNFSNVENIPTFNTYKINQNSVSNLNDQNLLSDTANNLKDLLNNQQLELNYFTLDTSSFFSGPVGLFTNSLSSAINYSTNGQVKFHLVPASPTTENAVYNIQNGELTSLFWSPDYNDVSAWIGYLFAENSGWVTGNFWPVLWSLLSGANPANGLFTYNGKVLPDATTTTNSFYTNAPTFAEQLNWTNQRRNAMGMGNLPPWAVSLYSILYNAFPNDISWNTNYGWWQLQYNNNGADSSLQYIIQDWASSIENAQVVLGNNGTYSLKPVQYTSQSSLINFLGWMNSLDPSMPFYSAGNNMSLRPFLSQKNVYAINNPDTNYPNAQFFINLSNLTYNTKNPFKYFVNTNIVSSLNMGYFSSVLGAGTFDDSAAGMYSGIEEYTPYNYLGGTGKSAYSAGAGLYKNGSAELLKLIDANNLTIYTVNSSFEGARYNKSGQIEYGDTLNSSNSTKIFVANPNPNDALDTPAEFSAWCSANNDATWSTYADYKNFVQYHLLTTTDSNLVKAMNEGVAYQYQLNTNIKWVGTNGQAKWSIQPEDFNNSLAWMAASMSDYSYGSNMQSLSQVQSNSYMLQEIGIAGNNYNLGVGSGFFQTEEYQPNTTPNGNTFTYFLSPSNTPKNVNTTGWDGGKPISYFLTMLASQTNYFDPMPSNALAFNNLPSSYSKWKNLTMGELTQAFLGNSSTTGVWNISSEMTNLLNSNESNSAITKNFNQLYQQLAVNPAYASLVADTNFGNASSIYFLYGSGINPYTGLPDMNNNNLYFDGGYYALPSTFTNSSLKTAIYSNFFNAVGGLYGPSSQKLEAVNYGWDPNITSEEELVLYQTNEISIDGDITPQQLSGLKLTGNQHIYLLNFAQTPQIDAVLYNALIYDETKTASGNLIVPANEAGNPLIQIDTDSSNNGINTVIVNNTKYYGRYGYPYLSAQGQVLYTNPNDKQGKLKSLVQPAWQAIVGTALNPFIYGTTGAEIRQDINTLVNWSAIADNADYPLPQALILNNIVPYGNFKGNFEYQCITSNQPVIVNTYYQYVASTSGTGMLGSVLYWSLQKNNYNPYYDYQQSNSIPKYSMTQYEWDLVNAINSWE